MQRCRVALVRDPCQPQMVSQPGGLANPAGRTGVHETAVSEAGRRPLRDQVRVGQASRPVPLKVSVTASGFQKISASVIVNSCTATTNATQAGHPPWVQKNPGIADPALPPT